MRILSATAALLVLSACATPTAPVTTTAADGSVVMSADPTDPGAKVVCRNMEIIGTRFPKKECKTKDAWDKYDTLMAEEGRAGADKIQRVGSGAATQGN